MNDGRRLDRTGQVWSDLFLDEVIFVVIGPARVDDENDVIHPTLVLCGAHGIHDASIDDWYEFHDMEPWEKDPQMERIA